MRQRDLRVLHEILEAAGDFGHREHLQLAWTYLHTYAIDQATAAMVAAIRQVARLHGAEDKYHETITRAWLHFVAVHIQRWDGASFEEFVELTGPPPVTGARVDLRGLSHHGIASAPLTPKARYGGPRASEDQADIYGRGTSFGEEVSPAGCLRYLTSNVSAWTAHTLSPPVSDEPWTIVLLVFGAKDWLAFRLLDPPARGHWGAR